MTRKPHDNTGVMFRNKKKDKPNQPDYNGLCRIDGFNYWISGWIKDGQGGKYMSLAFRPKEKEHIQDKIDKGSSS